MNDKISNTKFGVLLVDSPGSSFQLTQLGSLAHRVESAGFHRVGISDHSIAGHVRTYDPIVCLAALANHTNHLRIATQVLVLPLRHPLHVAHAITTLDQLSNGRIELGIGVGGEWPAEFESLGIDLKTRGKRTDESLEIITALWQNKKVDFSGTIFEISDVTSLIGPVQSPHPPIIIGGRSQKALIRAAKFGTRWDGIFLDSIKFSALKQQLDQFASQNAREVKAGMVMWVCIGEPESARQAVGNAMENFYQVPFGRFERYALWGSKNQVEAKIQEFITKGASDISLIPVGDLDRQIEELAFLNHNHWESSR